MTTTLQPGFADNRIGGLDILRGIAIFGMIILHASMFGMDAISNADKLVSQIVTLFVYGKFYAIFAILFGASFAIQFRKAEAKRETFVSRFIRRLFALFCFGIVAEIFFGFQVLAEYAIAGSLLLLVRRWSTKMLIITFFICCVASQLYNLTYSYVYVAKHGGEQYISHMMQKSKTARSINEMEENATKYSTVMNARIKRIQLRYAEPIKTACGWILGNMAYFLIGFICLRIKVFEQPDKHRRLIILFMALGLVSWAFYHWGRPLVYPSGTYNFYPKITFSKATLRFLVLGFGLIREDWLALTYIGAVLSLASFSSFWLKRFAFFSWAGRMALTNYMLHAMLFEFLFYPYALSLPAPTQSYAPLMAIILFGVLIFFSGWWLNRYQFGPLEWIWRSFTYWKWQPMQKKEIEIMKVAA